MAIVLSLMAIVVAGAAALITGDFTQMVYKPTRKQIYVVLKNRNWIVLASVGIWAAGFYAHLNFAAISPAWLITTGVITAFLLTMAFLMSPAILFHGVRNPSWLTAATADVHLDPHDMVIGLEINGDVRAFPIKWINRPHLVEDTIGGLPILMSYCMLCNSAMAFRSELNGQKLKLIAALQWENNVILYDIKTTNMVQQVTGEIIYGPDAGKTLDFYATRIMNWAAWKTHYPHTKVFHYPPQSWLDGKIRWLLETNIFEPNAQQEAPFFPTIEQTDGRLPAKTEVFGVKAGDDVKAYPASFIKQEIVFNDELGGTPLVMTYDAVHDAADIFSRDCAGQTLTFTHYVNDGCSHLLVDEETCSVWDMTGRAIAGPLEGAQLEAYPHFSRIMWYSWANFYPETAVAESTADDTLRGFTLDRNLMSTVVIA